MLEFRTEGFNGYAVKYSPFFDSRIAVAASANFGLVGNGRLYILNLTANGIQAEKWCVAHVDALSVIEETLCGAITNAWTLFRFDTQDSLYDTAWSEQNEHQIVVASGDGSVKLYDISTDQFPIQSWQEHKREVYSTCWNLVSKDTFCSSSWDGTIKIWSPQRPTSVLTLPTHSCTYSSAFSPHSPSILSSVASDSHLRIFDLRTPSSASNHLVHLIPIHGPPPTLHHQTQAHPPSECLTHDWNKYRSTTIATAGVDTMIRTFDIRAPKQGPTAVLQGHEYAVRKIAWSPHLSDVLLSASYDMTTRVWSDGSTGNGGEVQGGVVQHPGMGGAGATSGLGRNLGRMDRHTEFVTGVDWCLFGAEGWCASVGWDKRLLVWDVRAIMGT
ncbi:Peroxisomal targeting signal 2 receptor [Hyphodiscus hymeniophilus]|uniref:Peroxin-7 n=1 Tax=Hyphodiscus hymeniophilus TaxID=353542 RepID=A0A9P6VK16_9HELO|nr:Peroxisomal targeting signal 2 receptor [Hyphodiscus hymeniophilus]